MEWLVLLTVGVVIGMIYYFKMSSNNTEQTKLDKVVPIDRGHVTITGSSRNEFDITVTDENARFSYRVKDGNIVGVKRPGSDQYYEYMR